MTESTNTTLPILLLLDPWLDNELRAEQLVPRVREGVSRVFRLSEYGVTRSRRSADEIAWDTWLGAADQLLAAAEEHLQQHPELTPHYYLAGRAPLPLFAYMGIRLSKWAKVDVINLDDEWRDVPIRRSDSTGVFFTTVQALDTMNDAGKVAVFVSTAHTMDLDAIKAYMRERGEVLAGALELSTGGVLRMLTAETADAAAAQLDRELQAVRRRFPRHTGLVMFIGGPAQLAVMAGHFVNPHIHGPAEFPNFAGGVYLPALRFPRVTRDEKLEILALAANPDDRPIHTDVELRDLEIVLRDTFAGDRVELVKKIALTVDEFLWSLHRHDPHVLHLSAHGSTAGDVGLVTAANRLEVVPVEGFVRALRSVRGRLRLVVLNACHSAALAEQLRPFVDYVIGVDRPLHDRTAIAFTRGFYRALGFGKSVADALEAGRVQVEVNNLPGADDIRGFARPGFDPNAWVPLPRPRG